MDNILPGLKRARNRIRLTVYVDDDVEQIIRLFALENESNVSRVLEEIIKEFIIKNAVKDLVIPSANGHS